MVRSGARYSRRCGKRSEEHTSELQSPMRISYAVFFLKKKKILYYNLTCIDHLDQACLEHYIIHIVSHHSSFLTNSACLRRSQTVLFFLPSERLLRTSVYFIVILPLTLTVCV